MRKPSTNSASLTDDPALLELLLGDAASAPLLYAPSRYWRRKTLNAAAHLRRVGVSDFRGASSTIGLSFADNVHVDIRNDFVSGGLSPLRFLLESVFPVNKIFDAQVALTASYEKEVRRLNHWRLAASPRVKQLVDRYRIPDSTRGGCLDYLEIGGQEIAPFYLSALDRHDRLAAMLPFGDVGSVLEIGGGFGAYVHLLVENYPQIVKFIYLDLPVNLYVGTQYLKSFYGNAVRDYAATRSLRKIEFSSQKTLEIIAMAPWQIERLVTATDLVYNSNSFVEMDIAAVRHYAGALHRLKGFSLSTLAMLSYLPFDPSTTFDPEMLPGLFSGKVFERAVFDSLDGRFKTVAFVSRPVQKQP